MKHCFALGVSNANLIQVLKIEGAMIADSPSWYAQPKCENEQSQNSNSKFGRTGMRLKSLAHTL